MAMFRGNDSVSSVGLGHVEVVDPHGRVQFVELNPQHTTIGRKDVDIELNDPRVSRKHAEFRVEIGGAIWVVDLNSRNGIKVNDRAVKRVQIQAGDCVQIGNYRLFWKQPKVMDQRKQMIDEQSWEILGESPTIMRGLDDFATPMIGPEALKALSEFSRTLLTTELVSDRWASLGALLTGGDFKASYMAVLQAKLVDDSWELSQVYDLGPQPKRRISRTLLNAALREKRVLISDPEAEAMHQIELSIQVDRQANAIAAAPLSLTTSEPLLLYVILPEQVISGEWVALLDLMTQQFGHAEETWVNRERAIRHHAIERDLNKARELQQWLAPDLKDQPGLEVAGVYEPCRGVAGDFYELIPAGEGRYFAGVADVAGKGMKAALLTVCVHTALGYAITPEADLKSIMERLNAYLCEVLPVESFITMVAVMLEVETGRCEYINAGHPPMMVARCDGQVALLEAGENMPLGIMEEPLQRSVVELTAQDQLLMYSDGLNEAENSDEKLLGIEGLRDKVSEVWSSGASDLKGRVATLKRVVDDYSGEAAGTDDMTILALALKH